MDLTHGEIIVTTESSQELESSLAVSLRDGLELGIYDLDTLENPTDFQT